MNSWLMVMSIVTSFCGPYGQPDCRKQRIACIEAGADGHKNDVVLVEECLENPAAHVKAEPAKPVPAVKK